MKKWKNCSECGDSKMLTAFHRNKTTKDGFAHFCKTCQNAATKTTMRKRRESGSYHFVEKKICPRCQNEKNANCFAKDGSRVDCLTFYCKVCMNFERREKYKNNPLMYLSRTKKYFLSKLGMTVDDYSVAESNQKNLCAICGLSENRKRRGKKQRLAIDHNHNTMTFRGLLCGKCNTALGLLNVDTFGILNLEKAIQYLKESKNVTSQI